MLSKFSSLKLIAVACFLAVLLWAGIVFAQEKEGGNPNLKSGTTNGAGQKLNPQVNEIAVKSDNLKYDAIMVDPKEIQIAGKVIWSGREMR